MLASFDHNFLFIKTRKTAGTSLEVELSRHCGPEDIVTPISPDDEILRMAEGVYPRNFSDDPDLEERYREILRSHDTQAALKFLARNKSRWRFYNHMSAEDIRDRIPRSFWDKASKISIDRHPYDKVLSLAYFRIGQSSLLKSHAFKDVLSAVIAKGQYRNFDLYSIRGKIAVDILLRYENLADWPAVLTPRLNLPPLRALPRAKAGYRLDSAAATDVLTAAQKVRIQEACREEFSHFDWVC